MSLIAAIVGVLNGGIQAWNDYWKRKERQDDRNTGAMEQREKDREGSDNALADDRVRDSNDALRQRVQSDHQIETGTSP